MQLKLNIKDIELNKEEIIELLNSSSITKESLIELCKMNGLKVMDKEQLQNQIPIREQLEILRADEENNMDYEDEIDAILDYINDKSPDRLCDYVRDNYTVDGVFDDSDMTDYLSGDPKKILDELELSDIEDYVMHNSDIENLIEWKD